MRYARICRYTPICASNSPVWIHAARIAVVLGDAAQDFTHDAPNAALPADGRSATIGARRAGQYRDDDERYIESPVAVLLDDLPATVEWILEKH